MARIFNTYGPRSKSPSKFDPPPPFPDPSQRPNLINHSPVRTRTVNPFDGRVVSNFIVQALRGEDLTVYGDGTQTRSFQYIHDLVDGLIALMNSSETRPVNLGNGDEFTILEFAHLVRDIVEDVQRTDGVASPRRVNVIHEGLPKDDPQKRRPDTSRAKASLDWQPRWTVRMGLEEMVRYYKAKMAEGSL